MFFFLIKGAGWLGPDLNGKFHNFFLFFETVPYLIFLGSAEIQVKEPSDLNQYVSYDPTEEKYFCQICQKFTFRSRYNVRNHVEAVHFPNVFSYSCDFCEKAVGSKNALSIHMTRMHKN